MPYMEYSFTSVGHLYGLAGNTTDQKHLASMFKFLSLPI